MPVSMKDLSNFSFLANDLIEIKKSSLKYCHWFMGISLFIALGGLYIALCSTYELCYFPSDNSLICSGFLFACLGSIVFVISLAICGKLKKKYNKWLNQPLSRREFKLILYKESLLPNYNMKKWEAISEEDVVDLSQEGEMINTGLMNLCLEKNTSKCSQLTKKGIPYQEAFIFDALFEKNLSLKSLILLDE